MLTDSRNRLQNDAQLRDTLCADGRRWLAGELLELLPIDL
jgi:hypothetical protein